jgi:6-phosphogluconolactonase
VTQPPRIEVHPDADALATAVAGELLTRIADVQAGGGVPQVMLTGGTIAEKVHREVARLSPASEVDWAQVEVWWGDERFVAPDSEDRNALQARRAFLDQVGVDPARVHEMPSTADHPDPAAAAAAHADVVREHLAAEIDVVMLGIGPDGHVASLFPGFPQLEVTDVPVAGVTGSPKPPPERISMTYPVLNRARSLWFLASGDGKAEAVARTLGGADHHEVPAAGAHGREETIWFLDRPAASRL